MPNQRIASGIQAMGGIGLSSSTIGSTMLRMVTNNPMTMPKGSAIRNAMTNPSTTLRRLTPVSTRRVPSMVRVTADEKTFVGDTSRMGFISSRKVINHQMNKKPTTDITLTNRWCQMDCRSKIGMRNKKCDFPCLVALISSLSLLVFSILNPTHTCFSGGFFAVACLATVCFTAVCFIK